MLSKDKAARWALDRLPFEHRLVLVQARQMYLRGTREERWGEFLGVHDCATYVVAALQRSNSA